jgi:hypothetical protein
MGGIDDRDQVCNTVGVSNDIEDKDRKASRKEQT